MKSWGTLWRTASYGLAVLFLIVVFFIPVAIFVSLPERWRDAVPFTYKIRNFFYWVCIRSWFVPLTISNPHNMPQRPVIFAANHASALDIPLLGSVAKGQPHVWFALSSLVSYPLVGYIIKRLAVLVDISSPRRAVAALDKAVERIKESDRHLMIFPEGGRYPDGGVHDFFRGFAILAKNTQRPVVPVFIKNAAKVCAPNSIWIHYAPIHIIIGPEFLYEPQESDEQFLQRVRAWFLEAAR